MTKTDVLKIIDRWIAGEKSIHNHETTEVLEDLRKDIEAIPSMPVAYISGPLAGVNLNAIHENIDRADDVAAKVWGQGFAVICPHTNSGHMMGSHPEEIFMAGALELLRRSDVLIQLPTWESSPGARAEHALAIKLGKTIRTEV